ncbi:T-lymphocyte surface antigen Ly-9-like isoform X2 [Choloepus didactylus]|uniref:T-lymphocyte surface antigen Ly-9-like isoform X2 n=1 Tax=Choloepus didactylus TaxID=27675 RepID=UPI00189C870A|nr:T-lymphocyte surface antigen Ly-9-like isoform X2 [Choloepus didactylus]
MGSCSEDPHFCGAVWLLRFLSLLLGIWNSGALGSGAWDSGAHSFLKQIRGGSVLFLVNKQAEPEEISWGFGPESDYRVMMRVKRGAHPPTWVSLQEKYKQRVHVPNMTSLKIEKLTLADSGQYRARGSIAGGREFNQVFHLTVNEPVPQPQILTKPPSMTTSWCNVTLECTAAGATEDLNVTWESKDLPGGLKLRGTWGPVTSTSTLAVSLPLSQPTASITCGVSNSVDQKNVTLDLGRVCAPVRKTESHGLATASLLGSILGAFGAVLLTLGAGLYLWKTRGKKKKMEPGRGADLQEGYGDDGGGVHYAELSQQESLEEGQ